MSNPKLKFMFIFTDPIVSDISQPPSLAEKIGGVMSKPWFIGTLGVLIWIALLVCSIFLYKRRKMKQSLLYDNIKLGML